MSLRQRLQICLALIVVVAAPTSALAAQQSGIHVRVTGDCVGDMITGRVAVRAPAGTRFTVRLLKQRHAGERWALTKRSKRLRSRGGSRAYRVQFDVAVFDAYAYRLGVYRSRSRTLSRPIPTALCAPGEEVPEAPLAILLPLTLLGTASVVFLRRTARC